MKITEVRTRRFVFSHEEHPFHPTWRPVPERHQDVTVVEIHTDEGITGIGAGGVVALRSDLVHTWRSRAVAVAIAALWVAMSVRVFPQVALLLTPVLPFTSIGLADHLQERKAERAAAQA